MFKKNRTKISYSVALLLIVSSIVVFWFYMPFLEPKKFYIENHNKGFEIESNKELFITIGELPIEKVYEEFYDRTEYFMTDFSPNNLIITRLSNTKNLREQIAFQFKLRREIDGVKFLDYRKIVITDKTFEEAYQIIKNINFFKDNISLNNLIVNKPSTPEEIEKRNNYNRTSDPYIIKRDECEVILDKTQVSDSTEYIKCIEDAYKIRN